MERYLSLSQAARIIGVKRTDIQKKIQANELTVMEGTVALSDLKLAYPDAQYEDNTVIERVERIMEDAVHKMAMHEHEGAQVDVLTRRMVRLNKEILEERHHRAILQEMFETLGQQIIQARFTKDASGTLETLLENYNKQLRRLETEKITAPMGMLENQVMQFMQPHVRLLPSRHDYTSDKSMTLLESALRAGLAVDYGCNNGNCGKCKARLLAGKVEKICNQDYVFSEVEKSQGYILTCCNKAVTDVTLESEEAVSSDDIPLQTITAKVKKVARLNEHVVLLSLKTPRSQRLRFLAGQHVQLTINGRKSADDGEISAQYSIASCPCEPSSLEFHIPVAIHEKFADIIVNETKTFDSITIDGPAGNFVLNEDSNNSLIFFAWDTGFAPIKSLAEHAMSLDQAESVHLYWSTSHVDNHYMDNLCRAWNDALDNFTYTPIFSAPTITEICDSFVNKIIEQHGSLFNFDIYIAAPKHVNQVLRALLIENGVNSGNMHFESTFHGDTVKE